jgi:hypothetical protein
MEDQPEGSGQLTDRPDPQESGTVRPNDPGELARDLTLLALAIVIVNEAIFTAHIVFAQEEHVLVAQAGRFAVRAGLAYMTWQGFAWSRWVLAILVAVPAVAGPWQLASAYADGVTPFALLLTATVIGYFAATWLLVGSRRVGAFLRYRRQLRDMEVR